MTGPEGRPAVRVRVVVRGRVQGVFFRETCRREATRHGVAGWARNNADGTVEAAFEGRPEAVAAMLTWVRAGPRDAVVDDVRTTDETPQGTAGFTVA